MANTLFMTAVTEAEARSGIALLPVGRRRRGLAAAAERAFGVLFAERILPFDSAAARAYAVIAAGRRAAGRPISQADCQIAAIGRSRGARVAPRDVDDFAGCGIEVMTPWSADRVEGTPAYTRLFWAKASPGRERGPERIHLLEYHLADVGACFEALLAQPTIRQSLTLTRR